MEKLKEIIQVNHLDTIFQSGKIKKGAIRNVSFSIGKGEIVGIVGESGSGKSILMKAIIGLLPESAKVENGEIIYDGTHIEKMSKKELRTIRGKEIAMIFQDPMTSLNPLKKVGAHLTELIIRNRSVKKKEAEKMALEIIRQVGIPSPELRMNQYPHEFSGGMRQRVMIAMALSCQPKLLIADEPTTALDVTIQVQILKLLKRLQKDSDMSIALISHDLGVVASLCSRIIVMYGGRIMEEGTAEEIFYGASHPYTKALLQSIPNLASEKKKRLMPIEGNAPSLIDSDCGCPFAGRCNLAVDTCYQEVPDYRHFSETQRSLCFFATKEDRTNE